MVGVEGKDELAEDDAGDTGLGMVVGSEALSVTGNLGDTKVFNLLGAGPE